MTAVDHPEPTVSATPSSGWARLALWRSPAGQPPWARPALLVVAALAALSYGWNIAAQQPEIFYATAVRSMSMSWHNLFFAAFDPRATVSIDKLPGALWLQVLSVHLFGLHLWALNLPQAIEGTLTVLVLYRAVRRLTGPGVAMGAVVVCACTPATVGLNRGNVSDSLLVLLLVLAADAASSAVVTGRVRSLLLAGLWVGLAFQAKMLEAWLIVPSLLVIWLWAAPPGWRRRLLAAAGMAVITVVVSLSWMLAVTAVPHQDRPYVDGSRHDSVFAQVFEYNGFSRADSPSTLPTNVGHISVGLATLDHGSRADRVIAAAGGRDIGWLLPLAAVGLLVGLVSTRRRPRGDPLRAACLLWGSWLVIDIVAFVTTNTINAYYLGALTPPIAALSAIAAGAAWEHRARWWTRLVVALVTGGTIGYAYWLLAPAPSPTRALALGGAILLGAAGVALGRRAALAGVVAVLVAPAIASVALITESGGPFNTPYEAAAARAVTQADVAQSVVTGKNADALLVKGTGTRYVAAAYTSLLASPLIFPTGDEILPIGGFTGQQPWPTLSALQADFTSGRLHIVIFSPTRDPRMRWVMAHCINITVPHTGLFTYYCK